MYDNDRNIYQTARKVAGLTQERASEALGVSVESIRGYELGQRIPPAGLVAKMVDLYDSRLLAVQHLRSSAELARRVIPAVEEVPLSQAVCHLLSTVQNFQVNHRVDQLLQIAADGRIDKDERPLFTEIVEKDLNAIIEAAMAVQYSKGGTSNAESKSWKHTSGREDFGDGDPGGV